MEKYPLIVNINQNSLDDGPGIRTVIFFKGCPLSCVWCQNPETQNTNQEINFQSKNCINCAPCTIKCPNNAFKYENNQPNFYFDRCNLNFDCIKQCPAEVTKKTAKYYEIQELIDIITSNKVFYDNTGGGVTFSGGESLMFPKYVRLLTEKLKKENINICVETAGFFNFNEDTEYILKNSDLIYFDVKIMDPVLHKKYCGVSNNQIIENFKKIITNHDIILPDKKELLNFKGNKYNEPILVPRTPLIPDITATEENLTDIAIFLKKNQIKVIDLLAYNPLWLDKLQNIGKNQEIKYTRDSWMTKDELDLARTIFKDFIFEKFK
ncbi:MAG: glycyl-radical enzyme activating protein [archaeon]|nr:glycyl-radical enzyme activating protein [archaeon]